MITASQSFKIYQRLFKHFKSEEDSQALVQEIENVIDNRFEKEQEHLSTKEDIAFLREDMAKAEGRLIAKIAETKSGMVKWMVAFWVAQMLAILVLFLRK